MRIKKTNGTALLVFFLGWFTTTTAVAQTETNLQDTLVFTLSDCIKYAHENNILLKQQQIEVKKARENKALAKAAYTPSLSATVTQTYQNTPFQEKTTLDKNSYSGNYSLNASLTLYNGGKNRANLKEKKWLEEIAALNVEESKSDIDIAILQAYIQILYARESLKNARYTQDISRKNYDLGKNRFEIGEISAADLAQLESQKATNDYAVTTASNGLKSYILALKQLLEIEPEHTLQLVDLEVSTAQVLQTLPMVSEVYQTALQQRPEIQSAQLLLKVDDQLIKKAKAGNLPSLSLEGSLGTQHSTLSTEALNRSLQNNWTNQLSLKLSIPIFNRRSTKTAVNLARYTQEVNQLRLTQQHKDLYQIIDQYHLNALNYQVQYTSAQKKQESTQKSLTLVGEQFKLGMKNTVELVTAENNFNIAQQEVVQSKYNALLNRMLLEYYNGNAIAW